MHILATDDEALSLDSLTVTLQKAFPHAEVHSFQQPRKALDFVRSLCQRQNTSLDFAFLDVEMPGMTGIELAAELKKLCPDVGIFFVTGFADYAYEAYRVHARGYILKPVTGELIEEEMAHLATTPPPDPFHTRRVRLRTFGTFDAFMGAKPIAFSRTRAKELLAYLADRQGSGVTLADICSALFEDESGSKTSKKYVQNLISSLKQGLEAVGAGDILIKKWNYLALDTQKVDCDYYRFLEGDIDAINAFHGEYMSNYSWAEFTVGYLNRAKSKK